MKVAVLGANWSLCAEAIFQAVVPATGLPSPSVQSKDAPPHGWTSIPRCCLYQACSAGASFALKKMPPMPVTRFIESPMNVFEREVWMRFLAALFLVVGALPVRRYHRNGLVVELPLSLLVKHAI